MKTTNKPLLWYAIVQISAFCVMPVTADPPTGGRWLPVSELTDEFSGDKLDDLKWNDHNPDWQGRQPGFFSHKNVVVSGGKLLLTTKVESLPDLPEGYHTFTTAAVKSKFRVCYGYFEARCRPMKTKASSAFWFYHTAKDSWTEIDVFEICGAGEKWLKAYHTNAHVFRTPAGENHWAKPEKWVSPFVLADDYHVYGLEWSAKSIKWYVDGKMIRELENTHWHQPLHLNFDSETMPDWFGLPDPASLPATFSIDYVRAWKSAGSLGK